MSTMNVYDFNFDDTGYIGRDSGRKKRAEVDGGWGARVEAASVSV